MQPTATHVEEAEYLRRDGRWGRVEPDPVLPEPKTVVGQWFD